MFGTMNNRIKAIENSGVVKFTEQSGNVGEAAKVIVEGNGKGMTEEQLCKIGLSYYTMISKGTGLGIAISNWLFGKWGDDPILEPPE